MGTIGSGRGGPRERFVVTEAERQVADLLPIEVDPGPRSRDCRDCAFLVSHVCAEPR
jgi:hypothetical protein